MNAKTAEQLMQCHCGPERECEDSKIRKALKFAAQSGELKDKLQRQVELDASALKWISGIGLPADLEETFHAKDQPSKSSFSLKRALRQPPVLAVIIAVLVLIGWFIYSAVIRADNFSGRESVQQMIDTTQQIIDSPQDKAGPEFDPKATEAGLLGDWLFSQYGFENFYVPAELSHLKTVMCRVFKQDGFPVAQIAIEAHQSFLFVFRADDFGVKITPPDRWRIFEMDDWCVGILAHDDVCVLMAFHGTKADMHRFLAGAGKQP